MGENTIEGIEWREMLAGLLKKTLDSLETDAGVAAGVAQKAAKRLNWIIGVLNSEINDIQYGDFPQGVNLSAEELVSVTMVKSDADYVKGYLWGLHSRDGDG